MACWTNGAVGGITIQRGTDVDNKVTSQRYARRVSQMSRFRNDRPSRSDSCVRMMPAQGYVVGVRGLRDQSAVRDSKQKGRKAALHQQVGSVM